MRRRTLGIDGPATMELKAGETREIRFK